MSSKNFRIHWLVIGFSLCSFLLLFSGCRTKCIEGASDYPNCLGGEKPASSTEKQEIVFWNLYDPNDAFAGQIQAFQSAHPGIRITYKKFENEEEYETLLINEIAEGEGPDIFAMHHSWLPKHQKKISPMPESLMVPEKFRETFFSVAGEVLILPDQEGIERIYGIPLFIDTLALYYNKSIFRDTLPTSNKPGETWEDIKQQVFQLTKKDNSPERFALSGMAMGSGENISLAPEILSLLLIQQKTALFDEKKERSIFSEQQGTIEGTGKPFYPGLEAIRLYTSFALSSYKNYSWNQMITGLYPEQQEKGAFVRGKTAMIFGFSRSRAEILASMEGIRRNGQETIREEEIGIAPVPQFFSEAESGRRDALADFYPLTVSRNTKNADLAWEFLVFLSGSESAQTYSEKTGKPTARFDLIETQSIAEKTGVFARQVHFSKVLPILDQKSFRAIVKEGIESIARGKSEENAAAKLIQKRLQCVLEKSKGEGTDRDCSLVL